MRLTHIKLAGFKSFADPTTIHIPGRLVGVVGPNGCGKSNVIDAVRWVLGEASAKQLRGESMQDVIFNGAATRRPAPRAWVELVFDNSSHTLPGAWGKFSELGIKRQLTRQGESSYFINGQVVRRRDITDLFLGTGVGTRGYAVIEQGMISRIIEARPEELRAYLEEAAGVSKYKERRRETETRLKDTRDHLSRLADLQGELARQSEKLEKQAAAAERYRRLNTELVDKQNLLDYLRWRNALAAADAAADRHRTVLAQQQAADTAVEDAAARTAVLREEEQAAQQELHRLNLRHTVVREQTARLEEQIRAAQNLAQRHERERAAAHTALQELEQKSRVLAAEAEEAEAEAEASSEILAERLAQVAEAEAALPASEAALHETENALRNQQESIARLQREIALKRQQAAHRSQTAERYRQQLAALEQETEALNLPETGETASVQAEAERCRSACAAAEAQLTAAENAIENAEQALQTAASRHRDCQNRHLDLCIRRDTLAAHLNEGGTTAEFWPTAEPEQELWRHIQVADSWRYACAVILENRLQARAADASFRLPEPLPEAAAAWFYPDAAVESAVLPADALLHQLTAAPPFQVALNRWLDGIRCAPDMASALEQRQELGRHEIWLTPEGHRVDAVGAVLHCPVGAQTLLQQQADFERLTAEADALLPELEAAAAALTACRQDLEQWRTERRVRQEAQRESSRAFQAAQAKAAELSARTHQGQVRREHIRTESLRLQEEINLSEQAAAATAEEAAIAEEALLHLEEEYGNLAPVLSHQQQAVRQARLALMEGNRLCNLAEMAAQRAEQAVGQLRGQLRAVAEESRNWQQRQNELDLAAAEADDQDLRHETLADLAEEEAVLHEETAAVQARLADIQQAGRQAYAAQQEASLCLPALRDEVQAALLVQQEALLDARRFHDAFSQRGADETVLSVQAEAWAEADAAAGYLKALSGEIDGLDRDIRALGAVNLAALAELSEARERDAYYQNQSRDLHEAVVLLEAAIAQIDDETKSRFRSTFEAVNAKVQTFFPMLFGGGEAVLQMTGDDLLQAGVSIMARPPGKKNSTIHLLSGGEKALTAMSLVFALFSLNPAPFCLLDEVDAPLDDANVVRFCKLVAEMSVQTQFLYISHNRLTMEMAEQLIGVTMQEKGVSRIVAVDLDRALQMAES